MLVTKFLCHCLICVGLQYGNCFTVVVPRIWRWLLDFWKMFASLLYSIYRGAYEGQIGLSE